MVLPFGMNEELENFLAKQAVKTRQQQQHKTTTKHSFVTHQNTSFRQVTVY